MNKNIAIILLASLLCTNLCMQAMNETFAVCALKEKPFWWADKKPRVIQLPSAAEIRTELLTLSGESKVFVRFFGEFAAIIEAIREGVGFYSHMRLDSPWAITAFVTGFVEGEARELGELISIAAVMGDERFNDVVGMWKGAKLMKDMQPAMIKILLKNHPKEIKKFSQDLQWRPLPDVNELMKY